MQYPTVYLAGLIRGLTYEQAVAWREIATKSFHAFDINVLDPMRGKERLKGEKIISGYYPGEPTLSPRSIVARDLADLRRCDLVLAYLIDADRISVSTMIELGYAHALNVPIILVMGQANIHRSTFSIEIAMNVIDNLPDALKLARTYLLPG